MSLSNFYRTLLEASRDGFPNCACLGLAWVLISPLQKPPFLFNSVRFLLIAGLPIPGACRFYSPKVYSILPCLT